MENIYNILFRPPALTASAMPKPLEALAQQLVQSGRLRIEADDRLNFIRFSRPEDGIYYVFSRRELFHPSLTERTLKTITRSLQAVHGGKTHAKAKAELERLRKEIARFQPVSEEIEIKVARLLVQSAHPVVIMLILEERVPIFVSFAHTVGDMLDMRSWQTVGASGGLQSTDGRSAEVFVSCGGDPFIPEDKVENPLDGFAAMARLMVIAGQEIGHYSDIKRDDKGRQISRYASDLMASRATPHVREARLNDLARVRKIERLLFSLGLRRLLRLERYMQFYHQQERLSFRMLKTAFALVCAKQLFWSRASSRKMGFLRKLPKTRYPITQVYTMLRDMRANLAPQNEAYKFPDKNKEEAIACVEALARVPQQVNKWGHQATRTLMAGLYTVYYGEVIPGCIRAYEVISGKPFKLKLVEKRWWR
jgi:hypothetical protein